MTIIVDIIAESWRFFMESSVYILFGLIISGLIRIYLSPQTISNHLSKGRFRSVFKMGRGFRSLACFRISPCAMGLIMAKTPFVHIGFDGLKR